MIWDFVDFVVNFENLKLGLAATVTSCSIIDDHISWNVKDAKFPALLSRRCHNREFFTGFLMTHQHSWIVYSHSHFDRKEKLFGIDNYNRNFSWQPICLCNPIGSKRTFSHEKIQFAECTWSRVLQIVKSSGRFWIGWWKVGELCGDWDDSLNFQNHASAANRNLIKFKLGRCWKCYKTSGSGSEKV